MRQYWERSESISLFQNLVFISTCHSKKWSTFLKQDITKATAKGIGVILKKVGGGGGEETAKGKEKGAVMGKAYGSWFLVSHFQSPPNNI